MKFRLLKLVSVAGILLLCVGGALAQGANGVPPSAKFAPTSEAKPETSVEERMTRRRLPPENSFWTEEARDLLSDYLWSEGKIPPTGKLTLKDLGPDKLPIAERWSED